MTNVSYIKDGFVDDARHALAHLRYETNVAINDAWATYVALNTPNGSIRVGDLLAQRYMEITGRTYTGTVHQDLKEIEKYEFAQTQTNLKGLRADSDVPVMTPELFAMYPHIDLVHLYGTKATLGINVWVARNARHMLTVEPLPTTTDKQPTDVTNDAAPVDPNELRLAEELADDFCVQPIKELSSSCVPHFVRLPGCTSCYFMLKISFAGTNRECFQAFDRSDESKEGWVPVTDKLHLDHARRYLSKWNISDGDNIWDVRQIGRPCDRPLDEGYLPTIGRLVIGLPATTATAL